MANQKDAGKAKIEADIPAGMSWRDFVAKRFYGYADFADGREVVLTIDRVGKATATDPQTKKPAKIRAMTFVEKKDEHGGLVKALPLGVEKLAQIARVTGEVEPAKWPGKKVRLFGDPSVRNPNPGASPGGVRIKKP